MGLFKRQSRRRLLLHSAKLGLISIPALILPQAAHAWIGKSMRRAKSSPPAASGAPAFVQMKTNGSGGGTAAAVTVTMDANVAVGNRVVLICSHKNQVVSAGTPISGLGATWTQIATATGASTTYVTIWTAECVSAGAAITVTYASACPSVVTAVEFSGLSGTVESTGAAYSLTGTAAVNADCGTTTNASAVLIAGGISADLLTVSSGPTNSFTAAGTAQAGSGGAKATGVAAYRIVSAAGSYSTGWTMSGTSSQAGIGVALRAT